MTDNSSPIILAFSGGLDTSFCVPWLEEKYGRKIITATVDTGGIDDASAAALHDRAIELGASEHLLLDCKEEFFDSVLRHLIAGNVRRGQFYPLCVGAERGLQAARLAALAEERGATTVAHGCTAAGNDQVRFEVALRTLNPALETTGHFFLCPVVTRELWPANHYRDGGYRRHRRCGRCGTS